MVLELFDNLHKLLETSPEDIEGIHVSQGILTVRGGMTSHAAVVARGMGTCCVSGCGEIKIDEEAKEFSLGGYTFHEGDYISLDGTTGKIYKGDIRTPSGDVSRRTRITLSPLPPIPLPNPDEMRASTSAR